MFGQHYRGAHTDWDAIRDALGTVRELGKLLGDVSRRPAVVRALLDPDRLAALESPAETLRAALAELDVSLAEFGEIATFRVRGLSSLASDLEHWLAALAPFWRAADTLQACRRRPATSAADLLAEARDALACRAFDADFAEATPALQDAFGPLFAGLDTDWPTIQAALGWTERLRARFDREPPDAFVAALDAAPPGPIAEAPDLDRAIKRLRALLDELRISFVDGGPTIGSRKPEQTTLAALAAWARARHAALPKLREWVDARAAVAQLEAAGLGQCAEALVRQAPPAETWVDAFLRQLFTIWLTWRYEQAPPLAQFRRDNHQAFVDEFAALDRRQWQVASERIAARLLARRPSRDGDRVNGSEVGLLLREERKQRRLKPLRRLFAELPNLLPALKPCLLMSPLSVAQHLGESAIMFDLVIFDEASQILPPDAIGVIGRGRQVVVVGDRHQLPPTPFFRVTAVDTLDDDQYDEPPESVLDAALNAGLPERSLFWHYRSRHEDLIAFSNAAFYDGRLRTFPSPRAAERVVTLVYVPNGVYDRGGSRANHPEAMAVAELVVEHVEQASGQSLGVIAFSEAQMLAILAELEARKRARPELETLLAEDGEHGFFVKNLENVQGDERDVLLFSIGYGRDAAGHLTMNFGPLNAPGGERRLNVAVTRARERVTVVSSIRAADVDLKRTQADGVRQLKRYLEYADRGPEALFGAAVAPRAAASSPFEEAVRTTLTQRRLDVVAEVGVGGYPVDLAVRDDGRYLLGIECDGRAFRAASTARDRERLRQEVLEGLGWCIHRIWSTDWIVASDQEAERVVQAVETARRLRDGLLVDDAPLAGLKPEDQPFQGHTRPHIAPARSPGPVVSSVSASPVPSAIFLDRSPALTGGLGEAPPPNPLPIAMERGDMIAGSPSPATRGRGLGGGGRLEGQPSRSISAVPPDEIAATARTVLETGFAMPIDDLVVAVARQLGYQRTGSRIKAVVSQVLGQQLADGALIDVGGNVRLPDA